MKKLGARIYVDYQSSEDLVADTKAATGEGQRLAILLMGISGLGC